MVGVKDSVFMLTLTLFELNTLEMPFLLEELFFTELPGFESFKFFGLVVTEARVAKICF
jgi:hypothetical protein